MRISELAEATGVSVATLKYYLRERLVHHGHALGPRRADYDASHVERVRLVRALVEVGHLPIDRVAEVVATLEHPPERRHELLGAGHHALRVTDPSLDASESSLAQVEALGVGDCTDSPAVVQLALTLTAAAAGGWPVSDALVRRWYAALLVVADTDVTPELAELPAAEALRHVIVGTVLTDPVLLALRRVAQEQVSAERFSR
ncbi:MAG: MerR family transcriptional regulator [Humibacillus sp.]